VRFTLDATPLLGTRTGIGRYVAELLAATATEVSGSDDRLDVTTWSARGGRVADLPPGVRQTGPRVPARLLRAGWTRGSWPPVELLVGRTDVFHGTNFVSPPTRRAAEVVTVHDLTYLDHPGTVSADSLAYRDLVPRALDRGAHVVTPSETVAAAVRERYGLDSSRVTATPLGGDPAWAAPPRPLSAAAPRVPAEYLVFVGSLDPRKNLPRLLEAHAALRASRPGTPDLVLAGPAGRETALTARPGVLPTGWLAEDDLRALVAGARALALPSVDEGFGLPVLEALAAGRPVLAADIPALREVAGGHAELADPLDVEALADGLARTLDAQDDEPARAARRAWAARFTWRECARRTLSVYRRAARG
jgi:glycosyltransferase involved in cell wall biosynthesis